MNKEVRQTDLLFLCGNVYRFYSDGSTKTEPMTDKNMNEVFSKSCEFLFCVFFFFVSQQISPFFRNCYSTEYYDEQMEKDGPGLRALITDDKHNRSKKPSTSSNAKKTKNK